MAVASPAEKGSKKRQKRGKNWADAELVCLAYVGMGIQSDPVSGSDNSTALSIFEFFF